jgi:hypothetical protein
MPETTSTTRFAQERSAGWQACRYPCLPPVSLAFVLRGVQQAPDRQADASMRMTKLQLRLPRWERTEFAAPFAACK